MPIETYIETIRHDRFLVDMLRPVIHQPGPDAYTFDPYQLPGFAVLGDPAEVPRFARQEVAGRLLESYRRAGRWGSFSMAAFEHTHIREYLHRRRVPPYYRVCEHTFPDSLLMPGGMFGCNETQGSRALRDAVHELIGHEVLEGIGAGDSDLRIQPTPLFFDLIRPHLTR